MPAKAPRKAAVLRARPDLSLEAGFGPGRRVCGIDEVGRGPLCGPVVAAAVVLPPEGLPPEIAAQIDDSKAVTRRLREEIEPAIRAHALAFTIALTAIGIWLAVSIADLRRTQDCVLMGRRDCVKITTPHI